MKRVGSFEAKTHFAALLREVESTGEGVIVQRHGKDVAAIVPCEQVLESEDKARKDFVINEFRRIREVQTKRNLPPVDAGELINRGRKRGPNALLLTCRRVVRGRRELALAMQSGER
ncbi:MAG: type II toxin-antitoxin system Phd/YefM family antitoxin [Planctomycetota bacterium]